MCSVHITVSPTHEINQHKVNDIPGNILYADQTVQTIRLICVHDVCIQ